MQNLPLTARPLIAAGLVLLGGMWHLSARVDGARDVLIGECKSRIARLGLKDKLTVTLDKFDVTITGYVSTIEEREKVRASIDGLRGLRCIESNAVNHVRGLRVVPRLAATREENGPLVLSGFLSSQPALDSVVALLARAEPGLKIETSAVTLHHAVDASQEVMPATFTAAATTPFLASIWPKVKVALPEMAFDEKAIEPTLRGRFPKGSVRDEVIAAMRAVRPDLNLKPDALVVDATLPPVEFNHTGAGDDFLPPPWMKETWDAWRGYPKLDAQFSEGSVKLTGFLPNDAVRDAVVRILRKARPDLPFTATAVRTGTFPVATPLKESADLTGWTPPGWLLPVWKKLSL
jgi:hypothetical protein